MRSNLSTMARPRQRRFNFQPEVEALEARDVPVAQPLLFTLDQPMSALTLSGHVTTSATGGTQFPIEQQGAGSLTSTYSGTVNTNFDPNPITGPAQLQFVQSGTAADATVTGNWSPAVGGAAGSAPADYGGSVAISIFANVDVAMRNLLAALSTASFVNLSGGPGSFSFPSNQTLIITGGTADYRATGLVSGQGTTNLADNSATNTAGNGTLADLGNGQYRLTTPIQVTITETVMSGGTTINVVLNINGTTVGNAIRPVVDLNGTGAGFDHAVLVEAGAAAVPIAATDATITRAVPANLTSATITLTNRPNGADEILAVAGALPPGLSAAYDPATGVLQINGAASTADYQNVLRAITYQHIGSPGTVLAGNRELTVVFHDAQNESLVRTSVLSVSDDIQVIDNGDAGFTATPGFFPFTGQGFQDDVHFAGAGAGTEAATWTFSNLTPGLYRVSATWTTDDNRASNAPFEVYNGPAVNLPLTTAFINQETVPDDFSDFGAGWRNLGSGPFLITADTLTVRLSDAADEFVIADAIRIERVGDVPTGGSFRILDNGEPGFGVTAGWTYLDNAQFGSFQGVQGDVHFVASQTDLGGQLETATWNFSGLAPGQYQISTTWFPHPNRATNAPYILRDGGTTLATVRVNQELTPSDFIDAGDGWQILGTFTINSGTLTVELTNDADEFIIADSVRIEQVGFTGRILDNGEPGHGVTPGWTYLDNAQFGSFQGIEGDVHFIAPGAGSEVSTWTFTALPAGQYRVSATWTPHPNRATDAPFTVLDGAAELGTVLLNQEEAPNDLADAGDRWEDLGVFTINSGTLVVQLSDAANEFVIADAIRIERVA
jgi:hypothetical protein